jgi:hypothetical protein
MLKKKEEKKIRDPRISDLMALIVKYDKKNKPFSADLVKKMQELRELYIEFEQPTLVKSIRLVCEYAEAFEMFKIDAWEEEGGMSTLEYFLYLLNNAHNKYNKDELKSLNTYLKARMDGEEVEFIRPDEDEE